MNQNELDDLEMTKIRLEKDRLKLEKIRIQKEIWEKAVDTQMHFNEMSVKSRQLGLSFVVAALGLAVILLANEGDFSIIIQIPIFDVPWEFHVAGIIVLISSFVLIAVSLLDLNVYHRMLRGAVAFGEEIEKKNLVETIMNTPLGMTESISFFSRFTDAEVKDSKYIGKIKTTAKNKILWFYRLCVITLICIASLIFIFVGGKQEVDEKLSITTPKASQVTIKK